MTKDALFTGNFICAPDKKGKRVVLVYRVRLLNRPCPRWRVCAHSDWPVDKLSDLDEWRVQNRVHARWRAHMSHLNAGGLM